MADRDSQWYWSLKEHRAVQGSSSIKAEDRLGPYATEQEAANALNEVQARNDAWDNDPKWNDDEDD